MVTQIVIHLFPHEIDWFEWQIKQLKQSSCYLEQDDEVIIDVTLNLNLVDWNNSTIPKQFFINKFKQIEKICDWCECFFIIDENNKCLGCNDKRRKAIRTTTADNILYLDSDLFFSNTLLKNIIESTKLIDIDYYIISPQTVKMWDDSWDVITNQKYLNIEANIETYYNNDPFKTITNDIDEIYLKNINGFKFAGGWFNLLSSKLLKITDIPDSLGPYGVDDTYVMKCCEIMKQKNINVQQYVLEGEIIVENFKYRWNPYEDFIHLNIMSREYQKNAEQNMFLELEKFKNKIKQ